MEGFCPPRIESLAFRWSDRILEIREASQTLLLDQMRRLGPEGREDLKTLYRDALDRVLDDSATSTSANIARENTAIVILGVLGAEFDCLGDLTHTIAQKLINLLNANDNSIAKRTSVELIGRGFR